MHTLHLEQNKYSLQIIRDTIKFVVNNYVAKSVTKNNIYIAKCILKKL